MTTQKCILDLTDSEIKERVTGMGEPAHRAQQLQRWIYQGYARSFTEMTDLPAAFRRKLSEDFSLHCLTPVKELTAKDGTVKTLFRLADESTIESALMPYSQNSKGERYTVCLSTQVGCPVGCSFCTTGQQEFERNLSAREIIDQVLYFAYRLKEQGHAITNIVFMGMGEPLLNYESLMQSLHTLTSPQRFALGARHITISTAGVIPQMELLSEEKLQVGLAISLHAANNTLRSKLVPINRKYPLEKLISACREYYEKTGRRVSFEYTLFRKINDSPEQARELAVLLRGLNCHVNLIPANPGNDARFQASARNNVLMFQQELRRFHITCTVRQRMGLDIAAGCGQLRSRFVQSRAGFRDG